MPEIHINFLAILVAVVANFILGFLWYTPIFGRAWAKEMGFDANNKPPAGALAKGMIFMVIGNFLMAWVFAHNIAVWNPVTWGLPAAEMSKAASAFSAAIFTWLGFYFPGDLGSVAWENKSWKLFCINTGYHLVSLLLVAMILIYM
jgi:hypothetical protein